MYTLIVGADIAAKTVAIYWEQQTTGKISQLDIEQTEKDFRLLSRQLQRFASPQQTHIVMEATGTYWLRLAFFLHEQGFAVSVINPSQSRDFARTTLRRTKTDAIDAQLLCHFGKAIRPDLWTPPPAIYHQLHQNLSLRDDLLKTKIAYTNRLHALRQNPHAQAVVIQRIQALIDNLKAEIAELDQIIEDLLFADHDWACAAHRLLTIPGIGPITTAWLLTTTQAFERCQSPEQAAAFAGLVPHHRHSGTSAKGAGHISGGHDQLRSVLYMAAGVALQHNPIIKVFYQRLVTRGKIKQVARVAAARKLIHIAWAVVVKEHDFDPNFQFQAKVA